MLLRSLRISLAMSYSSLTIQIFVGRYKIKFACIEQRAILRNENTYDVNEKLFGSLI